MKKIIKSKKKFKIKFKINPKIGLVLLTILILAAPALSLYFNKIQLSATYQNTRSVQVVFEKETSLDAVKEKANSVKNYERLEKASPTEFNISYLDLSKNESGKLEENLKQIDGFKTASFTDIHKENPSLNSFIYIGPVFILTVCAAAGVLFKNFKRIPTKIILAKAVLLSLLFIGYLDAGILSAYSYFLPIDPEILETLVFQILLGIGLLLFFIVEINLTGSINDRFSLREELMNYLKNESRKEIAVKLAIIIALTLPYIYISRDKTQYTLFLLAGFIPNVFGITIGTIYIFDWMHKLSEKISFIKNKKWFRN